MPIFVWVLFGTYVSIYVEYKYKSNDSYFKF